MDLILIAVGRARRGPEKELYEHFAQRIRPKIELREVEEKRPLPAQELAEREAELILSAVPSGSKLIALDERGKDLNSVAFSRCLDDWKLEGIKSVAVVIGGANGLSQRVRAKADLTLCLGKMTWPHMMVRAMIAEQLYRAQQISVGHPYHRE